MPRAARDACVEPEPFGKGKRKRFEAAAAFMNIHGERKALQRRIRYFRAVHFLICEISPAPHRLRQ